MVIASSLTREQFVSWIGNGFKPSPERVDAYKLRNLVRHGDICLIWHDENLGDTTPKSRPIIGIPDLQIRDFFSFVGTYVGTYQPFTAFFRVAKISVLIELLFDQPRPRDGLGEKYVGAIIAETRSQLGTPKKELSEITIQSCLASISFPAVAGMINNVSYEHFVIILENWTKARLFLTDEPLPVPSPQITKFWQVVRYSADMSAGISVPEKYLGIAKLVSEAVGAAEDTDSRAWYLLTERLPKSRAALLKMRDSREERVRAMDVLVNEISSTRLEPEIAEALLGYSASRVAGGSLRYFQILQEIENRFPLAPLWFGLFCSLREETDALVIAECLGRRIVRHFNDPRNLFMPPTADISFDEFVTLMSTAKPQRWRTEYQTSISIEIFPGIVSAFRSTSRSAQRDPDTIEPSINIETLQEIRYLASRMLKTLDSVIVPNQGRLFPDNGRPSLLKKPKRPDR